MSEQETPQEVVVAETGKKPEEFLLSYQTSRGKERKLQVIALDKDEQEESEELIFQALARNPQNLRKDRLYLADYLFTKLVVEEEMEEEEFASLWSKSARELYHFAGELAQGKTYDEIDSTPVLLATISEPQERERIKKALEKEEVSLGDFRVKIRTENKETKPGWLLSGKQAVARLEKIERKRKIKVKEAKPEREEAKEDEVKNEAQEVKKYSLFRRILSLGPKLANQFDLTRKVEKWARKHPNVAFAVGGTALLAIAADLHPQEASELVKQGLETVDIFIKNQGWQLTPLGQRAVQLMGEAMPQVEAFAQHQSLLLNLSDYVTSTHLAQEVEQNLPTIASRLQETGVFFAKTSQGIVDLQEPQVREELVKRLTEVGVNSFNLGLDLADKGVAEAKDYLGRLAHQWGLTKEFYYHYPSQSA